MLFTEHVMTPGHSKNSHVQLIVTSIWGHPSKQILFQWIRNINYLKRKYFLFSKVLQSVVTPSFKSVNSFGAAEHSTQETASSPLSPEEDSKLQSCRTAHTCEQKHRWTRARPGAITVMFLIQICRESNLYFRFYGCEWGREWVFLSTAFEGFIRVSLCFAQWK